jgi:DNA-binding XRE family transcriptional regulator
MTRAGLVALGFTLFAPTAPAAAATAVSVPEGSTPAPSSRNSSPFGAVITNGQGEMKGKIFRIAHLGFFDYMDTIALLGRARIHRPRHAQASGPVRPGTSRRAGSLRQPQAQRSAQRTCSAGKPAALTRTGAPPDAQYAGQGWDLISNSTPGKQIMPELTFGEKLILARKQLNLYQYQMAEKLGVHPNSIWKYEQGEGKPQASVVRIFEMFCAQNNIRFDELRIRRKS